jgi:hypothetical protein
VIDSGLRSMTDSDGGGSLTLVSATLTSPAQVMALNGLMTTPHLYYVNIHTSDVPAGVLRGQVATETFFYKADLLPGDEVPAVTGLEASGKVLVTLDVTRDSVGNIASGTVMFDANFRFAEAVTLTGFHIHSGQAGENGLVVLNAGVVSATDSDGMGRIVKIISLPTTETILDTLSGIIAHPQQYYVNLHTTLHPEGAVRGQLADANQMTSIPFSVNDGTFRSNLGIQNLTDIPGRVLVRLSNPNGEIGVQTLYVPARGFTHLLNLNVVFGNNEPFGSVKLEPDQHIEAFVSVIQNASNVPLIVPLAP